MKILILSIHIIISILLVSSILLQTGKGGLGASFGGGEFFRSKRGAEKIVFMSTIVTTILFLISSILNLLIQ